MFVSSQVHPESDGDPAVSGQEPRWTESPRDVSVTFLRSIWTGECNATLTTFYLTSPLPSSSPPVFSCATRFVEVLEAIRNRHNEVVPTMAQGVTEYKEAFGQQDPVTDHNIQYFLDRFYTSRISIRMLINQHSELPHTHRQTHTTVEDRITSVEIHILQICIW